MTKQITSFFAVTTFVLAVSGSAFAADIAVKAPLPAPAPVYSWTGWYVGVNAGASFGRANTDFNAPVIVTGSVGGAPVGPGGNFGFAGSDLEYPGGFIGGGQIGYNWQYSPLIVVGLEADIQGALEKDSSSFTDSFDRTFTVPGGALGVAGSQALDFQTKIDWFGTVRGRIGYVWGNGRVLSYVTGGLAYGRVGINGTNTVTNNQAIFTQPPSFAEAFGHSQVNIGWVVGYGTEGVIDFWGLRNWTWKVEGLYMDLGTLDTTSPGAFSTASGGTFVINNTSAVTTHTHFTDGILRAGLNYQFH